MFKKILVPTDGSELSDKAMRAAVQFAREVRASIVAISVAQPVPYPALAEGAVPADIELFEKQAREEARRHVERVVSEASAHQVPCDIMVGFSFSPYEEIVRAAESTGCDVIFMASHGRRGISRLFVGSETQKVLAHTTIPVLVFR